MDGYRVVMSRCTSATGRHHDGSRAQRECPVHGATATQRSASVPAALPPGTSVSDALLGDTALQAKTSKTTDPDLLDELSRHFAPFIRARVAGNPHTRPETMRALGQDQDPDVPRWVAQAAHCPPDVLEALADHESIDARAAVARHVSTPIAALARLARDTEPQVRSMVASNTSATPEILVRLASDKAEVVVQYVAESPKSTAKVLSIASHHSSWRVRQAVASHRNVSADTLNGLINGRVDGGATRPVALGNPNASPDTLARYATSKVGHEREVVAGNPSTPPEVLGRMANDPDPFLLLALCSNPSTPPQALASMAEHPSQDVTDAARTGMRRAAAKRFGVDESNTEAIVLLADIDRWWELGDDDDQVRLVKQMHPDA